MLSLLVKRPAYIILALFLAIFLFVIYFILNNLPVFTSIARITLDPILLWKVFANQVSLIWEIGGFVNVLAVGLVSLLAGLSISLSILRVRRTKVLVGHPNLLALLGSFGGAFGAACAACNTSLIALLGVSGGLAIFPFKGLEISILSIVILLFSLYFTNKSIKEWGIIK